MLAVSVATASRETAVFAVLAGNYQPPLTFPPQKSSTFPASPAKEQRAMALFPAVSADLAIPEGLNAPGSTREHNLRSLHITAICQAPLRTGFAVCSVRGITRG
jgi:hypothetical protein